MYVENAPNDVLEKYKIFDVYVLVCRFLLSGAEIDACRPGDPGRYVEIKTTRIIRDSKVSRDFA